MRTFIKKFDTLIIHRFREWEVPLARTAIFVVYGWFGALKLFGVSPAGPLVKALFERTIFFMPFSIFYALFAVFEVAIGVLFLVRGLERAAIFFLGLHLFMTFLPLVMLPDIAWQSFLVPTLEGQYIIKNILIAASAIVVGSKLVPFSRTNGAR